MWNRFPAVAAAALLATVLGACTSKPPSQLSSTASVSVDGHDAKMNIVRCTQQEWTRTIYVGGEFAGAKIVIDEGSEPLVTESVRIHNLGGFTGLYSKDDGGNADMSLSGDKFTITGTAHGYKTDKPGEPASAAFKIIAVC
ncbi:lipoprotein LpqH [Mycobacterium parmense]|uniref:Uncharacterized protein n=1 Tax=Mycobacterium parmense TaxID=185642 RepID=A0A7I7Z1E0_9MYCO|nr:lipoprotein LpqH [Mycobacterium parmense]MCV7352468.1 lipoprotein LpqH [Mycobacterium parmense]ORW55792.1 hypothetical protein AWC20_17665 [Mycobacterium parmense]BBZ47810.1 hypothetical protein MPRM_50910 [Mycobacterium parmense]